MDFAKRLFGCNTEEEEITTSGTKVLITTGYDRSRSSYAVQNTEIVDLEDASFKCTVSQFPIGVAGATGGLVGDTPLICGGALRGRQYHKSCYSLKEDGDWKLESSLNTARGYAANG